MKSGVIGGNVLEDESPDRDQQPWKFRVADNAEPSPDEKASQIINKVPSSSLWTKTGGILLGTGLTAAAVSNELYVRIECEVRKECESGAESR